MAYFVGCSGWFYWHWKGRFYPPDITTSKWFKYYTEKFNTVELNSTFYHFPKISSAKTWYKNSPPDFVYTLKVSRIITHIKRFKGTKRLISDFYKVGEELKEKMGCFLFQLPPNLTFDEKRLGEIIGQLDLDKRNVIEFRHISWFNQKVFSELRKNKIIFCIVSLPNLPDEFVETSDDVYIRFHGKLSRYASNYSDDELKEWARKIKKSKAKNVWAYFNNDFNAFAPQNALTLLKFLKK